MRRAGLAVAIAIAVVAPRAHAFHAGAEYAKSASAGGGGGVFYTGAPSERRWDCRACHVDPPGAIGASFTSDPPSLFDVGTYAPGQSYAVTVRLLGEHLGLDDPATNTNGIALAIVDADGAPAGTIAAAPDALVAGGPATIASTGRHIGATEWSFTWRAPDASRGRVTVHLGMVDGDGAATSAPGAFSDPYGDDVVVASVPIEEARRTSGAPAMLGLALGAAFIRRRRR